MEKQTGTFNTPHGQGSMFGQVATGGSEMPWFVEERVDQWCVVKGTKEDPIETVACHETEEAANAQMRALYASENKSVEMQLDDSEKESGVLNVVTNATIEIDETEGDTPLPTEKSNFLVYKDASGATRWASISNVAIKDKEFEIVTEAAYDDAIEHAQKAHDFGEIDLVHVNGTDVGHCDLMMRVGNQLVEGGVFDDTDLARGAIKALEADPEYWGVSIKFVYDPSKFDGTKYNGNIRIRKRTILPQEMAASYGTKLVSIGGENPMEEKQLSDKAREALAKLNMPEEDIESLAEKQIVEKEPNEVAKEAEAPEVEPETVEVKRSLWDGVKAIAQKLVPASESVEPDAETGGAEVEQEADPVEAQEETKETDTTEMITAMADAVIEGVVESVSKNLEDKDKQIAEQGARIDALGEALLALNEQIKALREPIEDKVNRHLAELPRVAKVAASEISVTEATPTGATFPLQNTTDTTYLDGLMKDVRNAAEKYTAEFNKVQV